MAARVRVCTKLRSFRGIKISPIPRAVRKNPRDPVEDLQVDFLALVAVPNTEALASPKMAIDSMVQAMGVLAINVSVVPAPNAIQKAPEKLFCSWSLRIFENRVLYR